MDPLFPFCHKNKRRTIWGFWTISRIQHKVNLLNDKFLVIVNGFIKPLCFIRDIARSSKIDAKGGPFVGQLDHLADT